MAARRISKSTVDWTALYGKMPVREREVYKAMKSKSDSFVNKVHSNPEALPNIDFNRYKNVLPGMKMVEEFEKAYSSVSIAYPKDVQNVSESINKQEAETLSKSADAIKTLEHEKLLSTQYLAKLKELPPQEEFTMEMLNEYFPWTRVKDPANPKLFPFNKASQPENLTLNETEGFNNAFAKIGIKVKI